MFDDANEVIGTLDAGKTSQKLIFSDITIKLDKQVYFWTFCDMKILFA